VNASGVLGVIHAWENHESLQISGEDRPGRQNPMKLMKLGVIPGMVMLVAASVSIGAQNQVELTEDDIDQWMTELSNWGRWGQ
jgi:hypothetical protein